MTDTRPDPNRETNAVWSQVAWLSSAFETSSVVSGIETLRHWGRESVFCGVLLAFLQRLAATSRQWSGGSVLYTTALAIARGLSAIETMLGRWIRHSRGYRWLTAEPDPNVIVIDLRDAKTIAPLLRLLEQFFAVVIPGMSHSRTRQRWNIAVKRFRAEPLRILGGGLFVLALAGLISAVVDGSLNRVTGGILLALAIVGLFGIRDRRTWEELRTTHFGSLLVALFVPPEPPENDDRLGSNSDDPDHDHPPKSDSAASIDASQHE